MIKTHITKEDAKAIFRLCVDHIYKDNNGNLRCRSGYMMRDGIFIGVEENTGGWTKVEFEKEFSRCVHWVYAA